MKVIILCAGSSKRIASSFGGLHKALLPINRKPIISHLIDELNSSWAKSNLSINNDEKLEFIFMLGYMGELVKKYIEEVFGNSINIKFIFNDHFDSKESGPGDSLKMVKLKGYIDKDEEFICLPCDSLLNINENRDLHPNFYDFRTLFLYTSNKNSFVSVFRNNPNGSSFVASKIKKNLEFKYSANKDKLIVFNGIFYISKEDSNKFWNNLNYRTCKDKDKNNEFSIHKAINKLKLGNFVFVDVADLGTLEAYQNYKRSVGDTKITNFKKLGSSNEFMYFDGKDGKIGKVIKVFIKRYGYQTTERDISDKSKTNKFFHPINYTMGYEACMLSSEYIEGQTLSYSLIFNPQFYSSIMINQLNVILASNSKVKKDRYIEGDIYSMYNIKTLARLRSIDNNTIKSKVYEYFCDFLNNKEYMEKAVLVNIFSGDLQPENIMFDKSSGYFKFIDLKRQQPHPFLDETYIGDFYYDLAKLVHGLFINNAVEIEAINNNEYKIFTNQVKSEEDSPVECVQLRFKYEDCILVPNGFLYFLNQLKEWTIKNNLDWGYICKLALLHYANIAGLYREDHKIYYEKLLRLIDLMIDNNCNIVDLYKPIENTIWSKLDLIRS